MKRSYETPALHLLGTLHEVTLGSGGSCLDGMVRNKAVTGTGLCEEMDVGGMDNPMFP